MLHPGLVIHVAAVHADHVALGVVDRKDHAVLKVLAAVGAQDAGGLQIVQQVAFRRQCIEDCAVGVADAEGFQQGRCVQPPLLQIGAPLRVVEQRLVVELGRLVEQRLLLRSPGWRLFQLRGLGGDCGGGFNQAAGLRGVSGKFADRLAGADAIGQRNEVNGAATFAATETPPKSLAWRNDQAGFLVLVEWAIDFPSRAAVFRRFVAA